MTNSQRIRLERQIARRIVHAISKLGYLMNVNNGGDEHELTTWTNDPGKILDAMFAADEDQLIIRHAPPHQGKRHDRFISFIYGNDGWDVVADYSSSLEEIVQQLPKVDDIIYHTSLEEYLRVTKTDYEGNQMTCKSLVDDDEMVVPMNEEAMVVLV